jgi:hypothetical protein
MIMRHCIFFGAVISTLTLGSTLSAAELRCPPLFVSDGDQVVCAVANYGSSDQDVIVRMRDGRNGSLVEPAVRATLGRFQETGVHHNVVPPDGSTAPAHPVICHITVAKKGVARGSFARLSGAAAVDAGREPIGFDETLAVDGGEVVECR